jgi:hypothetical protein
MYIYKTVIINKQFDYFSAVYNETPGEERPLSLDYKSWSSMWPYTGNLLLCYARVLVSTSPDVDLPAIPGLGVTLPYQLFK